MGVRSLGKAFLDLLTGPGDAGASKKDSTDKDDSTPATSGSSAAVAYSRAGAVVERHGKPHLTAPQKAAGLGRPDTAQGGVPEPVMLDPTESAPQPPSAGKGQPAHGTPVSTEREALIRRAVAIHRAKRGILDTLSDEQKERLAQMALAAFRVKH
jgi:hypothetical protein